MLHSGALSPVENLLEKRLNFLFKASQNRCSRAASSPLYGSQFSVFFVQPNAKSGDTTDSAQT